MTEKTLSEYTLLELVEESHAIAKAFKRASDAGRNREVIREFTRRLAAKLDRILEEFALGRKQETLELRAKVLRDIGDALLKNATLAFPTEDDFMLFAGLQARESGVAWLQGLPLERLVEFCRLAKSTGFPHQLMHFEVLAQRVEPEIRPIAASFCRGRPDQAEEMVKDAVRAAILAALEQFRGGDFLAYCREIARNAGLNGWRDRGVKSNPMNQADPLDEPASPDGGTLGEKLAAAEEESPNERFLLTELFDDSDSKLSKLQRGERIKRLLLQLSPDCRVALLIDAYTPLSQRQANETLELPRKRDFQNLVTRCSEEAAEVLKRARQEPNRSDRL